MRKKTCESRKDFLNIWVRRKDVDEFRKLADYDHETNADIFSRLMKKIKGGN